MAPIRKTSSPERTTLTMNQVMANLLNPQPRQVESAVVLALAPALGPEALQDLPHLSRILLHRILAPPRSHAPRPLPISSICISIKARSWAPTSRLLR